MRYSVHVMTTSIDSWTQFCRYLILGTESSYYVSSNKLQTEVAQCIDDLFLLGYAHHMIREIEEVSVDGRAPKQSYALKALAQIASKNDELRAHVFNTVLPKVCRTFSTLSEFLSYMPKVSWGRNTRRALESFMFSMTPKQLAYQFTKYRNRNGYRPIDLLRLVHPHAGNAATNQKEYEEVFAYIADKWATETFSDIHSYLTSIHTLRYTVDMEEVTRILSEYQLSWEHIGKQENLKHVHVWNTLLSNGLPYTAMLRNIMRMCNMQGINQDLIVRRLVDAQAIQGSRIHPIQILQALKSVQERCCAPNDVVMEVIQGLEKAFELSFENLEPTSKRFLVAIDVSGSMRGSKCVGMNQLTACDAACAIALAFVKREPYVATMAFSHELVPFHIHKDMTLEGIGNKMKTIPFGATDCSMPMKYALDKGWEIDCFVVITDNETNCHKYSPKDMLETYRAQVNPNAKMIVLSTASTQVSIADPDDIGMLDIAGVDASLFTIIHAFLNAYRK